MTGDPYTFTWSADGKEIEPLFGESLVARLRREQDDLNQHALDALRYAMMFPSLPPTRRQRVRQLWRRFRWWLSGAVERLAWWIEP